MSSEDRHRQDRDDEQARSGSLAHVETENDEVHRDEQEPSTVGKETREEPDASRGSDQKKAVLAADRACSLQCFVKGFEDTDSDYCKDDAGSKQERRTTDHLGQKGASDGCRYATEQSPAGSPRPSRTVPQIGNCSAERGWDRGGKWGSNCQQPRNAEHGEERRGDEEPPTPKNPTNIPITAPAATKTGHGAMEITPTMR